MFCLIVLPVAKFIKCWWQVTGVWVWSIGEMIISRKVKYSEESLSQCHVLHHRLYMDWPGI